MRFLLVAAALLLSACASTPTRPAAVGEEREDLRPIVEATGFAGTVLLYDLRRDRLYTVYGEWADERRAPASTFKIANSLIALDAGVVADETTVLPWDQVVRPGQREWNEDLTLREAFLRSAVPHYQDLARRIGPERMQAGLDRLGYGNRDISGGIDRFWLDGGLGITPREQLDFLVRLYRNQLPLDVGAQETVKRLMLREETATQRIRGKTGWAIRIQRQVGWWVGWVERGEDVYFFVTSLVAEQPDPKAFTRARQKVTEDLLVRLGWLEAPAARD